MRGYELWANVNGIEFSAVQIPRLPKSVGHSHVLRRRTMDRGFHESVLMKLCEKTGRRLRSLDMEAGTVWLGIGTTLGGVGDVVRLSDRTADTRVLFREAVKIYRREWTTGLPTFFAVYSTDLAPVSRQGALFGKPKDYTLPKALDEINDRYGEYVVMPGSMFGLAGHHVPDRIGFRKTVSWDIADVEKMLMGKGRKQDGQAIDIVRDELS